MTERIKGYKIQYVDIETNSVDPFIFIKYKNGDSKLITVSALEKQKSKSG